MSCSQADVGQLTKVARDSSVRGIGGGIGNRESDTAWWPERVKAQAESTEYRYGTNTDLGGLKILLRRAILAARLKSIKCALCMLRECGMLWSIILGSRKKKRRW